MIDMIYLLLILDTWRKDVKYGEIKEAIYEAAPDKLKPLHVSEVFNPFLRNISWHLTFMMLLLVTVISIGYLCLIFYFLV
jgi:hypothetical protein